MKTNRNKKKPSIKTQAPVSRNIAPPDREAWSFDIWNHPIPNKFEEVAVHLDTNDVEP